eukprot:TRINITY_DN3681_c1_g1_i1.p1 TRINITY_DN3681_c1_g1~~TRINITY_DN3681_c1_g1_i1.p1  ORF type:complete len:191 (+),score=54.48 TRINITY_DN3681_c1_g1_i1:48-620(+)
MKSIGVLLTVGVLAATVPKVIGGANVYSFPGTVGGNVTVSTSWTWSGSDISMKLDVTSSENQDSMWIGVGWNPTGEMVGADFVIGYIAGNGDVCVRPLLCSTSPPPNDPPTLNITGGVFQKANNTTSLSFTRPAASGENPIDNSTEQVVLLAAATLGSPSSQAPPTDCIVPLLFSQFHDFYTTTTTITYK